MASQRWKEHRNTANEGLPTSLFIVRHSTRSPQSCSRGLSTPSRCIPRPPLLSTSLSMRWPPLSLDRQPSRGLDPALALSSGNGPYGLADLTCCQHAGASLHSGNIWNSAPAFGLFSSPIAHSAVSWLPLSSVSEVGATRRCEGHLLCPIPPLKTGDGPRRAAANDHKPDDSTISATL